MKYSYKVITPAGAVHVSDDSAGDDRLAEIYQQYGDCTVEVRDRAAIFGRGVDYGEPLDITTISKLYE